MVPTETLDSCKKVENQLVSFAAVGMSMDEEAVQEATSVCQASDKLIQVHSVSESAAARVSLAQISSDSLPSIMVSKHLLGS